jgi:hypothetical protein
MLAASKNKQDAKIPPKTRTKEEKGQIGNQGSHRGTIDIELQKTYQESSRWLYGPTSSKTSTCKKKYHQRVSPSQDKFGKQKRRRKTHQGPLDRRISSNTYTCKDKKTRRLRVCD